MILVQIEWRDVYARRLYGTATHALTADSVGFNARQIGYSRWYTYWCINTIRNHTGITCATKQYVDPSVNAALDGAPGIGYTK